MPGRGSYSNQGARDILCPFFRSHNQMAINCEGYQDDVICSMRYHTAAAKSMQQTIYCEKNYMYCEHYNALMMLKYDEEE